MVYFWQINKKTISSIKKYLSHMLKSSLVSLPATFSVSSMTAGTFLNPSQLKVEDKLIASKVNDLHRG